MKSAAIIDAAIVVSKLNYCNSLFIGASAAQLHRLQYVQNSLVRVICRIPHCAHITPVLKHLHWLPVCHFIQLKCALLTWKAVQLKQPAYLADLVAFRRDVRIRNVCLHD